MVEHTSVLKTVFLVPTAVGSYNGTCPQHARSRTHKEKHRSWPSQREKLQARRLYHGYLAFERCCGTSKTAERRKNRGGGNVLGVCIVLVGSSSSESNPAITCHFLRILNAQNTHHGARPGPILIGEKRQSPRLIAPTLCKDKQVKVSCGANQSGGVPGML